MHKSNERELLCDHRTVSETILGCAAFIEDLDFAPDIILHIFKHH